MVNPLPLKTLSDFALQVEGSSKLMGDLPGFEGSPPTVSIIAGGTQKGKFLVVNFAHRNTRG